MPPTLIATPGAANANAFLDVARGDVLAGERSGSGAWTAIASSDTKAALLITATRRVNSICYVGSKSYSTQSLKFPRVINPSDLSIPSDYTPDSSVIPLELELATFELALMLATSTDILVESDVTLQGITRVKAGSVEVAFKESAALKSLPDNVRQLIPSGWLCAERKRRFVFVAADQGQS